MGNLEAFREMSLKSQVESSMITRIVTALALLLYLASLALPAFDLEQGDDGYYLGLVVVLLGALSADPRWLANPLWIIGLVCLLRRRRLAALLTLAAASVLALLCLTYVGTEIAQNASGTKTTILKMGWGYYLWLSSLLVSTGLATWSFFAKRTAVDGRPESMNAREVTDDPEQAGRSED